jgi:serine/threonine protein kinase/tetratricopeptide (TPR) repeat protein
MTDSNDLTPRPRGSEVGATPLQTLVDRFEQAWEAGRRPLLDEYLLADGAERRQLLGVLVHIDLERRLKAGEAVRVETYLQRYAELGNDPELVLALIAREFQLRRRQEPTLTPDEYVQRFPDRAAAVQERLGQDATATGAGPVAVLPGGVRYRPVRFHARGGLGEVFVARDEEVHREVALKRMQPRHADDPDIRRRFLREAEITGRLEHPGIVPVYGVVQGADGQLCYAMRFIQGDSLHEAIQDFHQADKGERDPSERSLALRQLLQRFITVCNTIAYAHSRGVIHRDLKPGNIMLGKYGETLVVDWGLARTFERSAPERADGEETLTPAAGTPEQTQLGQAQGTPAYMSPEQAAGRWDVIGPATDIYSLGATLYALLTGQPPFRGGNPVEVMQLVQRGAVMAPRQVKKEVPPALEAVCLKAMALKPEDRYPTAQDLAADIEPWLADEPVSAYREPWRARLRRWVRRRRTLVSSVAVAVLVLVLGGGAAAWWYEHERAIREAAEAEQATVLKGKVERALNEAETLARQARELTGNPTSWRATLAAAQTAANHAEALLGQLSTASSSALAAEVRQVQERLQADEKDRVLLAVFDRVREEQGQLDPSKQRLKLAEAYPRLKQALADYGLALGALPPAQAATLLRQRPPAVQEQLMGLLQECWFRAPKGEAEAKRWLAALLSQADGEGWRQQVRQEVEQNQGVALAKLLQGPEVERQPAAFLVWLGQILPPKVALGVLRRAQQRHPGDFWVNFELGSTLYQSVSPRSEARLARAEELPVMQEAVRYYIAALALRPGNAPAHNNLGLALQALGEVKGAVACYQKALDLEPKNALARYNLGNVLYEQGEVKGAIAYYHKSLELDPNYAPAHTNLGAALKAQGDVQGAIACYHQALALDPKYVMAHNNLGSALFEQGDVKGAIACFTKALDLDPKLALVHTNLGLALYATKDVSGAVACYRKALELNPKDALAQGALGQALLAQGEVKGAIECYTKALDLDPKLVQAHYNLGLALQAQGDFQAARASTQKALQLLPPDHPLRSVVTRQLHECQRLLELDARLLAILTGDEHPADTAEQLALADLCQRYRKRYAAAARFYADAFAAGAALTTKRAYDAACAAVLAACGQGEDADKFGGKECLRLRQQARAWLREALQSQTQRLEDADAKTRAAVRQTLEHWQQDADLARVRDAKALTKLPEAERQAWQQLWDDVDKLRKRASDKK